MKSRKFRVGVIGTGGIFRVCHLPGWKEIPDVEIVGVADVDIQGSTALANAENIPHAFADYRDLLKLDFDAVDNCTPNNIHLPAVTDSLKAGKHVLCEKPLATSVREVRQMGLLADRKKLKLITPITSGSPARRKPSRDGPTRAGWGRCIMPVSARCVAPGCRFGQGLSTANFPAAVPAWRSASMHALSLPKTRHARVYKENSYCSSSVIWSHS